jgi:hypothetical protein
MLFSRSIIRRFILGAVALTIQSALADTNDPKLAVGSHQAELADVTLHYVVAGHGPLVFVTSPGWGIGSLYLQRYFTLWHDDPRFKHAIDVFPNDSVVDTDAHFEAYLGQILPLYFSDPTRYMAIFEQQYAGSHLSSFAGRTQDAADKLAPRYQSREYDKVRAKTLIISGTVDFICPLEVSERMHNRIVGSKLSLYANVGHFPYIEEPTRFFSEVSQFLAD